MKRILTRVFLMVALSVSIHAEELANPAVEVIGAVNAPGSYPLQSGESIGSILEKAKASRL